MPTVARASSCSSLIPANWPMGEKLLVLISDRRKSRFVIALIFSFFGLLGVLGQPLPLPSPSGASSSPGSVQPPAPAPESLQPEDPFETNPRSEKRERKPKDLSLVLLKKCESRFAPH